MKFNIQVVIEDEQGEIKTEEVIQLEKPHDSVNAVGLTLSESKQLLKELQTTIVLQQAKNYTNSNIICPRCHKKRRVKSQHRILYRTLFGNVSIPALRLFQCTCKISPTKTFSLLNEWLPR